MICHDSNIWKDLQIQTSSRSWSSYLKKGGCWDCHGITTIRSRTLLFTVLMFCAKPAVQLGIGKWRHVFRWNWKILNETINGGLSWSSIPHNSQTVLSRTYILMIYFNNSSLMLNRDSQWLARQYWKPLWRLGNDVSTGVAKVTF